MFRKLCERLCEKKERAHVNLEVKGLALVERQGCRGQ